MVKVIYKQGSLPMVMHKKRTAADIIEDLALFFAENPDGGEQERVWNILSALRGPDMERGATTSTQVYDLKYATTARIRFAAFGQTMRERGTTNSNPAPKNWNEWMQGETEHFHSHRVSAAYALKQMGRWKEEEDASR